MKSSKLPNVINVDGFTTRSQVLDAAYKVFFEEIGNKNIRPRLFGRFIYVDCMKKVNSRPEIYWHIVGLTDGTEGAVQCSHEKANTLCQDNCVNKYDQVVLTDGKRNCCCHRAVRVHWIKEIIRLANANDPSIKVWIKDNKLHVRFLHETVDYIIILLDDPSKGSKNLFFISAFPVIFERYKQQYDKDLTEFLTANLKVAATVPPAHKN
jgi:hypothetical protein